MPIQTTVYYTGGKEFARVTFQDYKDTETFWKRIKDRFYIYGKEHEPTKAGFFFTYIDDTESKQKPVVHIICRSGDYASQLRSKLLTSFTKPDPNGTIGTKWKPDLNDIIWPRKSFDPGNLEKIEGNWFFVPKRDIEGGGEYGEMNADKYKILTSKPIKFWHNLLDAKVKTQITNQVPIAEGIAGMSLHHSNKRIPK